MNLRKDHYRCVRRRRPDSVHLPRPPGLVPGGPKASRTRSSAGSERRGPRCPSPPAPARNWNRLRGARRAARPPHGCPVPAVLLRRARGGLKDPGPARLGGAVTRGARGSACRSVFFSVKPPVFVSGCCQKPKSTTLSGGSLGSRVDEERS